MKLPILFAAIFLPALAGAQETSPATPQTPAAQDPIPMEDPALPMPGEEPTGSPGLLPESTAIPESKTPVADKPLEHRATSEHRAASHVDSATKRLEEARETAARNPHAMVLMKLAEKASNSKVKRRYLRAYYTTICGRMRKLEPDLRPAIDAYEEQKTGQSAASSAVATKHQATVHRSKIHRRATAQLHRRHRYRLYEPPEYEDYPPQPFFYGPPPGW
jgi:hypothetical protein